MGEQTKIEWCDHTFNPWRGCEKVSAGCAHCYAETLSKRNPAVLGEWGKDGRRVIAAESAWREPLKWDRQAAKAGGRRRVFCGSMCDVFEDRANLVEARARLLGLIAATPNLDWLLLTKRPENVERLWEQAMCRADCRTGYGEPHPPSWFPNVWIGTSVEDQASAEARVPALLGVDAAVRFLSCEPLLGPVDLKRLRYEDEESGEPRVINALRNRSEYEAPLEFAPRDAMYAQGSGHFLPRVDWVICGGESGPKARPMHPDWARGLRDQCAAAGVPFFFKQWGAWELEYDRDDDPGWRYLPDARPNTRWVNLAGGHGFNRDRLVFMRRVGKKAAGRELDGRTWEEFPGEAGEAPAVRGASVGEGAGMSPDGETTSQRGCGEVCDG